MIKEKLLVEALERRVEGANPFPVELLNETELGPSARGQAEPELDRSPRLELPLEHVFEGGRADALFDLGRRWAYRQSKGSNLTAWIERVLVYLIQQNQRFPTSLEFHEVKSTALSIDRSGDFAGLGGYDHTPSLQARRGRAAAKVKRYRSYERDLEIVERRDAGESQRSVALALGVSRGTVQGARARLSLPRRSPRSSSGLSTSNQCGCAVPCRREIRRVLYPSSGLSSGRLLAGRGVTGGRMQSLPPPPTTRAQHMRSDREKTTRIQGALGLRTAWTGTPKAHVASVLSGIARGVASRQGRNGFPRVRLGRATRMER